MGYKKFCLSLDYNSLRFSK